MLAHLVTPKHSKLLNIWMEYSDEDLTCRQFCSLNRYIWFCCCTTFILVISELLVCVCVCVCACVYVCVLVTQSCPTLQPDGWLPTKLPCPWNSSSKNTVVGCIALSRGSFWPRNWTCISSVSFLHCSQILYPLSHGGSPSYL